MASPNPDSPEAFTRQVQKTLLKGFIIPVVVLLFYVVAIRWLDQKLHDMVAGEIARDVTMSATKKTERQVYFSRVDFAEVCGDTPAGLEGLRRNLDEAGICGQFHRLQWGLRLSILLVVILAGVTLATLWLNRRANASAGDLIKSYRLAWKLSIAAALAKLLLLIPLLAYGCFELTTLAAGQYFPKLIIIIVVGGLVALWRGIKILTKRVPLEFDIPMARAITPVEAPRLWQEVRAAATRLSTAPPNHILIGMEHNFYVTELAVNYDGGRAEGRTLYLSRPLMQHLAPNEVMAIIGHELGHFRGEDTRMTREFYPLRFKAQATLHAIAESGWVGWTSLNALLFFHLSFLRTEQAMSRSRELLADRAAADLTSPTIMGWALVKVQVFAEAFNRIVASNPDNPFAVPMSVVVRDKLVPQAEFWTQLFELKAEHPLDSHPALRVRLEALDQTINPEMAAQIATMETESAYSRWFSGKDELFSGIVDEALQQVSRLRTATADYDTEEGKQLLDRQFPEVRWRTRGLGLWFKIGMCSLGVLITCVLFIAVDDWGVKMLMLGLGVVCAVPAVLQWRRHRSGAFVLRADSLDYSGWTRPLRFAEVGHVSVQSSYGSVTLTFHLKAWTKGIWKYSPFGWMRTKSVVLPLGLISGKQNDTLQTIHRYFTRQLPT